MVMSVPRRPGCGVPPGGVRGRRARQDAEERAARQARETGKDDEGVVDTEGWAKPDAKGELPPGKSS